MANAHSRHSRHRIAIIGATGAGKSAIAAAVTGCRVNIAIHKACIDNMTREAREYSSDFIDVPGEEGKQIQVDVLDTTGVGDNYLSVADIAMDIKNCLNNKTVTGVWVVVKYNERMAKSTRRNYNRLIQEVVKLGLRPETNMTLVVTKSACVRESAAKAFLEDFHKSPECPLISRIKDIVFVDLPDTAHIEDAHREAYTQRYNDSVATLHRHIYESDCSPVHVQIPCHDLDRLWYKCKKIVATYRQNITYALIGASIQMVAAKGSAFLETIEPPPEGWGVFVRNTLGGLGHWITG